MDRRVSRLGDRAEDERRRNGARRRSPAPSDEPDTSAQVLSAQVLSAQVLSAQVLSPFASRPDPQLLDETKPAASLGPDALWTLIDAVDGGGSLPAPVAAEDVSSTDASASQAESLYLLLAQVIGDDLDDDDDDHSEITARL